MSDKKYKTIGQVGRETDELLKLINKLFLDINYNEKGYYTLSNIKPDRIITIKYT
jgi:ArsR family metal-binding transcriptional regulator